MWRRQFDALGEHADLIAPDMRGFGASHVDKGAEFSIPIFAEDVRETLDALEVERAVLAGCSMGGYTIFEFWRRYPERVQGIILCDTRPDADPEPARQKRMEQIRRVEAHGTADMPDSVSQALPGETTRKAKPELIREIRQWVSEVPPATVVGTLKALAQRADSLPTLKTINVPTLVVIGQEDTVSPIELGRTMAESIPGAKLVTIPQAGHLAPFENPQAVNAAIEEFLEELK